MTQMIPNDTDLFSFEAPSDLKIFLDAARVVARDCADHSSFQGAHLIRALALADVLPELSPSHARTLLFHVARDCARANPSATWSGLHDAASVLLGVGSVGPVAVVLPNANSGRDGLWTMALPESVQPEVVFACDPTHAMLYGPWRKDSLMLQSVWEGGRPLSALDGARLCVFELPYNCMIAQPLPPQSWHAYANAQTALLTGLLSGACERLAQEALSYAQQRQSAGKPIAHHQAVALRLADLTMNQEALFLHLATLNTQGAWLSSPQVLKTSGIMACGVARDAVQTAAGHGFISGLPFKSFYEQVGTLNALLSIWCRCLEASVLANECLAI